MNHELKVLYYLKNKLGGRGGSGRVGGGGWWGRCQPQPSQVKIVIIKDIVQLKNGGGDI